MSATTNRHGGTMRALIYWTIPGKTFDAYSALNGGTVAFSTGNTPTLCDITAGGIRAVLAPATSQKYSDAVTVPDSCVAADSVRVLTFFPSVDGYPSQAIVVLGDGRMMDVGINCLRMLEA